MKTLLQVISLAVLLTGCEAMYNAEDDGIPRIRNQRDVAEYNATVSSEGEKLVCTKERVIGSNFPRFVCMTLNQRDRMSRNAQRAIGDLQSSGIAN